MEMRFGIFGRIEKREKRQFKGGETGYSENLSFRGGGADKTKGKKFLPLCAVSGAVIAPYSRCVRP